MKDCKACEGTLSYMMVIEVISNLVGIALVHSRGCMFLAPIGPKILPPMLIVGGDGRV